MNPKEPTLDPANSRPIRAARVPSTTVPPSDHNRFCKIVFLFSIAYKQQRNFPTGPPFTIKPEGDSPMFKEQQQFLKLLGQMASGIAHNLNNQMMLILNHPDFAPLQIRGQHIRNIFRYLDLRPIVLYALWVEG
jgi:hypothetical protein